jgi:plastocyanin
MLIAGTPGAFTIVPRDFTVAAGSRARWHNTSNKEHKWQVGTAAALDVPKGGDSAWHTFSTAGTFSYKCTIHPGMTGTITVT